MIDYSSLEDDYKKTDFFFKIEIELDDFQLDLIIYNLYSIKDLPKIFRHLPTQITFLK